jgi:hypothetical protein
MQDSMVQCKAAGCNEGGRALQNNRRRGYAGEAMHGSMNGRLGSRG